MLLRRRSSLQRMLKQLQRDIEWLERKQALAEFVAADRINSGRTDIPTLVEVVEWDVRFRQEYRRLHKMRNHAMEESTLHLEFTEDGHAMTRAQSPQEILAEDEQIQQLDSAATAFAEPWSKVRGEGFGAAELLGEREPKLSLLPPYPDDDKKLAFWAGAYQRIGLL